MTYRESVEQAALALKRGEDANWDLARLTFENTLERGVAARAICVSMEQWCADVRAASGRRFSARTGARYRQIWQISISRGATNDSSWSDIYNEVQGQTPDEGFARQHGNTLVRHGTPEAKRETFQQLASDPDVIQEAAMVGTPTSRAVSDLYTKTERVREEHREREIETDPISKRLDQVGAALDLESTCNRFARDLMQLSERFAREINAALPRTGAAREEHLYWVRQAIGRAKSVLDELESYAETGRTDLDAFLEGVLGGR